MSQAEHEHTHHPVANAEIQPLGYLVSLQFHPPIKLIGTRGLEFATQLSAHFDPRGVNLQENQWIFTQPLGATPAGVFQVLIGEAQVTLEAAFPPHRLEWFEERFRFILDEFRKGFTPAVLLASNASIRGTLQMDGDARIFLTTHVTMMEQNRLAPLARPVHLFGIRLVMPPYQLAQKPAIGKRAKRPKIVASADSLFEVKVESFVEDLSKLYLETTGQWQTPTQWDKKTTDVVVGRLATVSEFLNKNLIPMLSTAAKKEDG
jgi:hypothetical protein